MAKIIIEFDTINETLDEVLARLQSSSSVLISDEETPEDLDQMKVGQGDTVGVESLTFNTSATEAANTPPPPPPPGDEAVNTDESGIPWDERIHSASKAVTAKGMWKRRRGVTDELFAEVQAELTTLMAAGGHPPPPPPADQPAGNTPPPPPPAPSTWTWATLLPALMKAVQDGSVTPEQRDAACAVVGVEQVALLSPRPELYDAFAEKLGLVLPA